MKVPTKVVMTGDLEKANRLVHVGKSQLRILEEQLKRQGRDQGSRTTKIGSLNAVIECWTCFALSQVHVHVNPGGFVEEPKEKLCFCSCHLSVGNVRLQPGFGPFPHMNSSTLYDVLLCNNETRFVLIENVPSTDRHAYYTPRAINKTTGEWGYTWGEPVVLIVDIKELPTSDAYISGGAPVDAESYKYHRNGCMAAKCMVSPMYVLPGHIMNLTVNPPPR